MSPTTYFKGQRFEKIRKQLEEQQGLFVDNVFPSTSAALGSAVESLTEAENIEWKRPRDLCENPRLVPEGGRFNMDISGGKLMSMWFLQAVRVLAGIKELLFKVIINSGEQEFNDAKYVGMFRFKFWRFGEWTEVIVDDTLPCVEGRLLFSNYSAPGVFWPCLLEKAYAKILGSYGALEEGHICDALVDLTGGVTETIDLKASDVASSEDDRAELFRSLSAELSQQSIVCASIPMRLQDDGPSVVDGFAKGRMYHVTSLKKIHIQDSKFRNLFKGREKLAVIRIRDTNPTNDDTGSQPGSGTTSPRQVSAAASPTHSTTDSSPEDDTSPSSPSGHASKMLSRKAAWSRLKKRDHARLGLTVDYDGEVWLPFEDFCRYFHELSIVRLYNHNLFTRGPTWLDSFFRDSWLPPERSGGGNSSSSSFFNNPQFLFDVKGDDQELVLQLLQEGGSEPASASSTTPPHRLLAIGLTIFLVERNRKFRMHRLWEFTPKAVTVDHQRKREITYRGSLHPGRYLLVPSAFRIGSQGSFLIRAISQSNVKLRPVKRDIPREFCGLSCMASPVVWVTVLSMQSVVGLPDVKDVFCTVKCEKQAAETAQARASKDSVSWDDSFVFYRRKPERPITISVFAHNTLKRNQFLGVVELQATVNHSPTHLEVSLIDKEGGVLTDRKITVLVLTEDDLSSV